MERIAIPITDAFVEIADMLMDAVQSIIDALTKATDRDRNRRRWRMRSDAVVYEGVRADVRRHIRETLRCRLKR